MSCDSSGSVATGTSRDRRRSAVPACDARGSARQNAAYAWITCSCGTVHAGAEADAEGVIPDGDGDAAVLTALSLLHATSVKAAARRPAATTVWAGRGMPT